ncbi:MAG: hypothetical protein Q4A08_08845 [Bacteroidales bacterium]|nr:hypothetical protein [Bacteroidales bacterium]
MKQKQFDLEAAKAGKPVCTRNGKKVRIVCFDRKSYRYPILALVQWNDDLEIEEISSFTAAGKYHASGRESEHDLVMA